MSVPQVILTFAFLFLIGSVLLILFLRAIKGPRRWFCCRQCGVFFNTHGETTVEEPDDVDDWPILCDSCLCNNINQENQHENNTR